MIKEIDLTVEYYYPNGDRALDYCGIILYLNDEPIAEYGDWYHDKGDEKTQGFIACLESVFQIVKIHRENKDGGEWGEKIPNVETVPIRHFLFN